MDFSKIDGGRLEGLGSFLWIFITSVLLTALLGCFTPVQLSSYTANLSALFRSTIEKAKIRVRCAGQTPYVRILLPSDP